VLLNEHVRPDGPDEAESVTVPVKLPLGVTLISDDAVLPANVEDDVGLAESVKSTTERDKAADCDWEPLVPVTVTVY